jgi:hypothetical protein
MQDNFIFIVVGLYRLVARRAETSSPFSGPTLFCNRFARKLTRFDALSDDLAKQREIEVHARARSIRYATPEKGSVRPFEIFTPCCASAANGAARNEPRMAQVPVASDYDRRRPRPRPRLVPARARAPRRTELTVRRQFRR